MVEQSRRSAVLDRVARSISEVSPFAWTGVSGSVNNLRQGKRLEYVLYSLQN